jgi:hypothetical protein
VGVELGLRRHGQRVPAKQQREQTIDGLLDQRHKKFKHKIFGKFNRVSKWVDFEPFPIRCQITLIPSCIDGLHCAGEKIVGHLIIIDTF